MQFQVPQFIEVEDKIFGPLTFKQFVYVAGGAGACYLLWRVLPLFIAAPLIALVGGLAAGLAFLQFNGRPFIQGLEHGFFFLLRRKLYLWSNAKKVSAKTPQALSANPQGLYVPKLSESKLHELAWSLDIQERIAAGINAPGEREDVLAPIRTAKTARVR